MSAAYGVRRESDAINIALFLSCTIPYHSPGKPQSTPDTVFRRQHAVLTYIQAHYLSPLSLDDIAHVPGLSPNHVCAQFARVVGCSFVEYLTRLRLQHACTLLEETSLSVTEVAFASDFRSLSNY